MEEDRTIIFNNSTHVIGRLQLLSAFFEEEIIYKIYLKSQVIHSIFENNPELDVHKLELFHLQYTESVIELLKKIKKNNEKSVSILYDEIEANNDLIAKINNNALTEQQFEADRQGQAQKISISIHNLYENLADLSTDYPFPKTINKFSIRYAEDFYTEIPVSVLETITTYDFEEIYKNGYAGIDKKLLGLQCKHEFKNVFICGLKADKEIVEVYKLQQEETYFLFYPSGKLFLFCDMAAIAGYYINDALSKQSRFVRDLKEKNSQLEALVENAKTEIPAAVTPLLNNYYKKIADINFLDSIDDFDVEANILKTMLNTDGL